MKDIFDLKMKASSTTDITEKRIQASLLFVTLKKLNRLEKLRLFFSKILFCVDCLVMNI